MRLPGSSMRAPLAGLKGLSAGLSAWLPAWLRGLATAFALALLPVLVAALPTYDVVRERAFDMLLARSSAPRATAAAPPVIVVDIDRASLDAHGAWPWRREHLARLITTIATAKPRAVGLDILLAEPDQRSPAALARALAAATGDTARSAGAETLLDGDRVLAEALASAPTLLGAVLGEAGARSRTGASGAPGADPAHTTAGAVPVLVSGTPRLPAIWTAPAEIAPIASLARAAAGVGVIALLADADGRIRRVPLLAGAGDRLVPGLAVELARVAADASVLVLSPRGLAIGDRLVPTGPDAMLRLRPRQDAERSKRTISAAALLAAPHTAMSRLTGAVVLVGSSAPEAGGLRVGADGDLLPSVELQADAVLQILRGDAPWRSNGLALAERIVAGLAALAAAWAGWRLAPARGVLVTGLMALAWPALALGAAARRDALVDPLLVPLAALAAFAACALTAAARTWAREARIRARFAQHVAPEVVERLATTPGLDRLDGEMRTVTVLVSDIEGFTGLVERSEPRALVALLDSYVDGMSAIVMAHGGMVNKIVGDSLIALFNAPLDLPDHERRAVGCAEAMRAFARRLEAEPQAAALGLGRTRIGIETGPLIVGDVGRGAKIDYTGYGDAINTAARLEAANKELGSDICVGERTAAAFSAAGLRPIGHLTPRGRSRRIAVYEPWPAHWSEAQRAAYATAFAERERAPEAARAALAAIAARHSDDAVTARLLAGIDDDETTRR